MSDFFRSRHEDQVLGICPPALFRAHADYQVGLRRVCVHAVRVFWILEPRCTLLSFDGRWDICPKLAFTWLVQAGAHNMGRFKGWLLQKKSVWQIFVTLFLENNVYVLKKMLALKGFTLSHISMSNLQRNVCKV